MNDNIAACLSPLLLTMYMHILDMLGDEEIPLRNVCMNVDTSFTQLGNCGVCISVVWVNLWASVWTDLKQNTDMMHEQSMNHISSKKTGLDTV